MDVFGMGSPSWGAGVPGEQGFLEKGQGFLGSRDSWRTRTPVISLNCPRWSG